MKKLVLLSMVTLMLLAFGPMQLKAADKTTPTPVDLASPSNVKTSKSDDLILRLDEINEMDKTSLNFSEKKELRKEIRTIKKELKQNPGGIYISAGAAILILILLIILL